MGEKCVLQWRGELGIYFAKFLIEFIDFTMATDFLKVPFESFLHAHMFMQEVTDWCSLNKCFYMCPVFSHRGSCFYVCPVFSATTVWLRGLLVMKFKPVAIIFNSYTFLLHASTRLSLMCDQCFRFHFKVFWKGKLFSCMSSVICQRRLVTEFVDLAMTIAPVGTLLAVLTAL